jgi:hypothetical protein
MLERPTTEEYAAYYEGYIKLVPEGNIIERLEQQSNIVKTLLSSLTEEQANYRYAEGKWSVKAADCFASPEVTKQIIPVTIRMSLCKVIPLMRTP